MDTLSALLNSVVNRPYVFVFLAVHLVLAISHLGLHRALLFTGIGYTVALICEASSIRTGFPFGLYLYHPEAFADELSIAGVPFWDSLSFPFLTYFSYTLALLLYCPLHRGRGGLQLLETKELRRAPRVLMSAALFMAMIDTVIDPITLQGKKWFLGDLYHYPEGGIHFGVPLSNYLGWYFVGLTTLMLYTLAEMLVLESATGAERGCRRLPHGALLGSLVYLGVLGFMWAITAWVGDFRLLTAGVLTYVLPIALVVAHLLREPGRATEADLRRHLADFPRSPLAGSDRAGP